MGGGGGRGEGSGGRRGVGEGSGEGGEEEQKVAMKNSGKKRSSPWGSYGGQCFFLPGSYTIEEN